MYDSARKLATEAASEASRVQHARAAMDTALENANGGRALLAAAERAGQQVAAELASARAFGKEAREQAERLADLADQLHARKHVLTDTVQKFTASVLPSLPTAEDTAYFQIVEEKMRPLLERINVREPVVANAWADQAENHARRIEDLTQQAQAIIAQLRSLDFSACDLVDRGEEAAARAEAAASASGAAEIDVELLQKANICLAKLSPPDALQTSAAVTAPARRSSEDLLEKAKDRLENDRITQEKERLQKEKIKEQERRDREDAQRREQARKDQLARQAAEQQPQVAQQTPDQNDFSQAANFLESLVAGIAGGIQQQQIQRQLQQSSQPVPRPQPQTPQASRATPETRSPPRAPAVTAPSGPKYFALIASASKPSMLAYQKIPECRFLKHTGPFPISQTKPGEIDKAVSDLRAQGHTGVEARYFSSEQEAERFKEEWDRRVGSDTDKCYDAQFRYTKQGR
jgi:hypothetical protein